MVVVRYTVGFYVTIFPPNEDIYFRVLGQNWCTYQTHNDYKQDGEAINSHMFKLTLYLIQVKP